MDSIDWPELPDSGAYLHWPSEGTEWVHPDDLKTAEELIPSTRVFRRVSFDGIYYTLEYGDRTLRVKPVLWLKVDEADFRIGDTVGVLANNLERDPMIATIHEIHFEPSLQRIVYGLMHREMPIDRNFNSDELRLLTSRSELKPGSPDFVVQPPADVDEGDLLKPGA